MELKGRRELFCREYLKDLNQTQAALRAGYPPTDARTYASRMMGEAEIQDRVTELAAERNEKLEVDAREVLAEMLRLLRADALQAFNDDGTIKPWHEIPIDCRRAISGIKSQETFTGSGDAREWTGQVKEIKFWSKDRAIEMLARHLALFKDSLGDGLTDLAKAITEARSRGSLV